MELINATRLQAMCTLGVAPDGRESLVVVIKGTFRFPPPGESFLLHEEQLPLVMADVFTGEPGVSAPSHECDFAPRKQRCDVLLNASAHAPNGQAVTRLPVGVRIGNWHKSFAVVGDRYWDAGLAGIAPSSPQAFFVKPISYDVAFGGVDRLHADPAEHSAYAHNPVGRGYHRHVRETAIAGQPLPNTEGLDEPITRPDHAWVPYSFGVVGRGWTPRLGYAGTYDEAWLENHFPFLPPDFDERYYQAAPLDQQLPFPLGGQEVVLHHLTPDGRRAFTLPAFEAPVYVFPKEGGRVDYVATLDTIMIEPDLERFTLTWRASHPFRKNPHEVLQILVGRKGRDWWKRQEEVPFYVSPDLLPLLAPAAESAT